MQKSNPRRITGQVPETYRWVDRKPASARPVRREPMRENSQARQAQALKDQYMSIISKALMYLLIVCVVFVGFMQIGKMTQITAQEKENAKIAALNEQLDQEAQNLESQFASIVRREAIVDVAMKRLHMIYPTETQTAYLNLAPAYRSDGIQTAEGNIGSR